LEAGTLQFAEPYKYTMADKEKRNPSIVDVAQKAGVSAGTVSRVINSNPKISAATVKRVVSAMDDLGYQPPHPTRRRGKSSRAQQGIHNNQVAVVPINTGPRLNRSPLITKTWTGIQKALEREDLSMVISAVDNLARLPAILDPKKTDGVIIEGLAPADKLRAAFENMPTVFIFACSEEMQQDTWFDQVLPDSKAIGLMAAEYLRDKGRTQVAFLNPDPDCPACKVRGRAFFEAAPAFGLEVQLFQSEASNEAFPTLNAEVQRARVEALVDQLLASNPRPTGVFIPSDYVTCLTQVQLLRKGVVPGKDITLISCNNEEVILSGLYPRPATIDIRPELVGDHAVDQLLWRIANRTKPGGARVTVPPKLVEGDL